MCIHPACDALQSDGRTPFRQYTYRPTCNNTVHRMWDYHRPWWEGGGEGLFCLGAVDCWLWGTTELLLVGTTESSIVTLRLKHKVCFVGGSVWKQCTNIFRISSTNSSFTTKLCACVSTAFLAMDRLLVWG